MKSFKIILFLAISMTVSCVQDKEFDAPKITDTNPKLTANTTIAELKKMTTNKPAKITRELILEGYVVSSDEAGNFYRTLHFQDSPTNPTQGLQLDVDLQDMYTSYHVGRKIYIKLKGLYVKSYKDVIQIGMAYKNKWGTYSIKRLSAESARTVLFRSNEKPEPITPKITTIENITDEMINTLIKLENVQVSSENSSETYAKDGVSVNVTLEDCKGKTIVLRSSGFSSFYDEKLPTGNGSIVGVLGKYKGMYQLTIRDTSDVKMDNERCPETEPENPSSTATSKVYFSEYSEGSSYNKYFEIYNGTGEEIDLSDYSVKLYYNETTPAKYTLTFDAGTKLADKGTYVIYNSRANDVIKSKGNKKATVTNFNGDDAIELWKGNDVIDVIGKVGEKVGKNKGWSVAGVKNATKDHTLIRKMSVAQSNPNWKNSAGTSETNSEWIVKEKDDWTSIGVR